VLVQRLYQNNPRIKHTVLNKKSVRVEISPKPTSFSVSLAPVKSGKKTCAEVSYLVYPSIGQGDDLSVQTETTLSSSNFQFLPPFRNSHSAWWSKFMTNITVKMLEALGENGIQK